MKKHGWLILWIAFAAGVLATFVQLAVPPLMPALQAQFKISYASAGMLMSMFALATLIFATPCGFIIQRFGVRKVGLLGMGLMFAGLAICLFAPVYSVFLLGRAVQGIGFGLVAVSAPTAIGQFVPKRMMAIAMGIWSTWIPVGTLIVSFAAPRILEFASMRAYWILLMSSLIPGFVAFALVIPKKAVMEEDDPGARPPSRQVILDEIKNINVWFPAITFACFTFGIFSFLTWSSTYLTEKLSLSLVTAATAPILYGVASIAADLYGGVLLHKFGHSRWLFLLPPIALTLLWPLFTIPNANFFFLLITVFSLISGIIPAIIFASGPMLARRREGIGVAMAIIIVGENAGILIGPEVFGVLRQVTNSFSAGFWVLSLGALIQVYTLHRIFKTGVFAGHPAPAPAPAPETETSAPALGPEG